MRGHARGSRVSKGERRMKPLIAGLSLLLAAGTMSVSSTEAAPREQPLLFVSSFAGGAEGGIQALRLDLATGRLTPLHRTPGIENAFFLALSPDGRFLYSIQ